MEWWEGSKGVGGEREGGRRKRRETPCIRKSQASAGIACVTSPAGVNWSVEAVLDDSEGGGEGRERKEGRKEGREGGREG